MKYGLTSHGMFGLFILKMISIDDGCVLPVEQLWGIYMDHDCPKEPLNGPAVVTATL